MGIYMKNFKKLSIAIGAGASTLAGIQMLNSYITNKSLKKNVTKICNSIYESKFGKMPFYETGTGTPIILLHDLSSFSSSFEWKKMITSLSKTHKVFVIDLLGCGFADKPFITYTIYMYVQFLQHFIKDIINEKTDIVATGLASSIAIMTSYYNPDLIDNIILINPVKVKKAMQLPDKYSCIRKKMIAFPILGTFLYNICASQVHIKKYLLKNGCYNNKKTLEMLTAMQHETAHLSGHASKYIYMSTDGFYTTASIDKAIKKLKNISIIIGENLKNADSTISEYLSYNHNIHIRKIKNSAVYPHIENPLSVIRVIRDICNEYNNF